MGGIYARYVTTATSSDEARVAKFYLSSDGKINDDVDFAIDLNFFDPKLHSDHIEFEVSSSSEVAVSYDIVLILPEGMTELIEDGLLTVSLDGGTTTATIDKALHTLTFTAGTFNAAQAETRTHELTFTLKTDNVLSYPIRIEDPITLRIHAEQID